jgi:AhpD family alkylhydroperoxidase
MKTRLDYFAAAPESLQAMLALEQHIRNTGLEESLIHLVKIRASQINGCAYCIHMHTRESRAQGESEERIYLLSAWRESPLYTERERAALAWTEALTLVSETHAPDKDYVPLQGAFSEKEIVDLTLLIGVINTWNRMAIGFRAIHPTKQAQAKTGERHSAGVS